MPQTATLIVILLCLFSFTLANYIPYSIKAEAYTTLFQENYPIARLTANTQDAFHILSVFPSKIREVQLFPGIFNYTNANNFSQQVLDESYVVTSFDIIDVNFTNSIIDEPNRSGMEFNGTLPNGATISITYYMNLEEPKTLEIPRVPGDTNCTLQINKYEGNCSCDQYRTLKKDSFEFSMIMTKWPFLPLQPDYKYRRLIMNLDFTGDFDIAYYLSLPDIGKMISFETCDVGKVDLELNDVEELPLYFFANAYADDYATQIGTIFDKKIVKVAPDGVTLPFQLMFDSFTESLVYDPDLSILLKSNGQASQDDTVDSDDSINDDTKIILIAVLIPVAFLIIVIAVVIFTIVLILKKRRSDSILQQADTLLRG